MLCSSHHIPPGFPVGTFLPTLAVLLQLIEPLTTPSTTPTQAAGVGTVVLGSEHTIVGAITSDQKKQLVEVLLTFSKAYKSVRLYMKVDLQYYSVDMSI